MILILCEKKDAGCELSSVLEGDSIFEKKTLTQLKIEASKGFLIGEQYIVTWASGHLYKLPQASSLDNTFSLSYVVKNNEEYRQETMLSLLNKIPLNEKRSKRQIKTIQSLFNDNQIDKIIIATDADAEGESIGRDIIENLKPKFNKEVLRFWNTGSFKSKKAVYKAMNSLKPYDDDKYQNLYHSQVVRSSADYLLGMKLTKVARNSYNKELNIGRVKSCIESLVAEREIEIKEFTAKPFYQINGYFHGLSFQHFYKDDENLKVRNYYSKEDAKKVLNTNKIVEIIEIISKEETTKKRLLPLSATDFASEMMGKYDVSYSQCNDILAYLRESGFTTYQGTNGRYFSHDDIEEVKNSLLTVSSYFNKPAVFSKDACLFDNKKAEKQNHAPLHTTEKIPLDADIKNWDNKDLPFIKEGYELIAKRILVSFLEPDLIESKKVVLKSKGDNFLFELNGKRALKQGWRTFVDREIKNTLFESNFKKGDEITLETLEVYEGHTKEPKLYTMKSLIDTLLNVSRVVEKLVDSTDDKELKAKYKKIKSLLKNAEGIGTDRTRETIIQQLFTGGMIQENTNKEITLTSLGWDVYNIFPPTLKSIILTAEWERHFESVRRGEAHFLKIIKLIDNHIMDEMIPYILNNIGEKTKVLIKKRDTLNVNCPLCGNNIIETDKVYKCENNNFLKGKQSGCTFSMFKDLRSTLGRVLEGEKDCVNVINTNKDKPLKENNHGVYFDKSNKYFLTCDWSGSNTREDASTREDVSNIVETPKTFRLGELYIFKDFRNKPLTKTQAEKILMGKEVKLKRKSKKGVDYTIKVKLGNKGSLETFF